MVAQPLTLDYLAAQLPIFQPKIPTAPQVIYLKGFIVMVTGNKLLTINCFHI